MEHEQTARNQQLASGTPLSLPRFEEEATLLSARPVVPLHEVKMATRSKRRLVFALAILAATLIGALGTTLVMQRVRIYPNPAIGRASDVTQPNNSNTLIGESGGSAGSAIDSDEPTPSAEQPIKGNVQATPSVVVANKQTPRTARGGAAASARDREAIENEILDLERDEIEMRRAERRERRRLKRETEDERRSRREHSVDDLMRIREIFEGPGRP